MAYEYDITKYPEYPSSAAIAGKQFVLWLAYGGEFVKLGGCRSNGLSISSDAISADSKDSGGWGESVPSTRSWSSSLELVLKSNNETLDAIQQWVFSDDLQAQRPALHFVFVDQVQNRWYSAWAIISNYEISADHDDVCIISAEINGVGPITVGEDFVPKTEGEKVMNPAYDFVAP